MGDSFSEAEWVEIKLPGLDAPLSISLHGDDDKIVSQALKTDHCWEYYESLLTLRHLSAGDVFVDVGANIGYYTLVAAARVGRGGKVIAYEPDSDNFAKLKANVAHNELTQVSIFPYALYDKNKSGKLFLSPDNYGDHRIYASPQERNSKDILLVHGAEHVGRHTQRIDFLKIDTQGAEFFVVNGLRELIVANREHLKMVLEFTPFGLRHSGASGRELLQLLDSFGMQYHIIDHHKDQLIPIYSQHLTEWIESTDNTPDNEGFMNLFITPMGYPVV